MIKVILMGDNSKKIIEFKVETFDKVSAFKQGKRSAELLNSFKEVSPYVIGVIVDGEFRPLDDIGS